ncbi:MAG: hypothetical protein RLZZ126_617 [Pseudomonadota bacterium]
MRNVQDAMRRGDMLQHLPIRAQQCSAERGRSPVNGNKRHASMASTCAGRGKGSTAPKPWTLSAAAALA